MNLPCVFGRANGTWPFGELSFDGQRVVLSFRPHFIGRLFGAPPFQAGDEDLEAVFRVVGYLGARGLGFRDRKGTEYYFWKATAMSTWLLGVLGQAGLPVSYDVRRARQVWAYFRPQPPR